ncbi:MAG: STING domain-containing protein [Ferruginibacter sp.]
MPLLTAAAAESAIEVGITVVKRFFQPAAKKDQDLVSIGLAVGYFYNFLDQVSSAIQDDELSLYQPSENNALVALESSKITYEGENVNMQVIIPKRLDVEAFKVCEDEFKQYSKGFIYLKRNKRFYGINYFTAQVGKNQRLTIVDLARPVMAVKRYYEEILGIKTYADNKWLTTQLSEISAFKESLRNLQKLGYGVLVNKLSFNDLG